MHSEARRRSERHSKRALYNDKQVRALTGEAKTNTNSRARPRLRRGRQPPGSRACSARSTHSRISTGKKSCSLCERIDRATRWASSAGLSRACLVTTTASARSLRGPRSVAMDKAMPAPGAEGERVQVLLHWHSTRVSSSRPSPAAPPSSSRAPKGARPIPGPPFPPHSFPTMSLKRSSVARLAPKALAQVA